MPDFDNGLAGEEVPAISGTYAADMAQRQAKQAPDMPGINDDPAAAARVIAQHADEAVTRTVAGQSEALAQMRRKCELEDADMAGFKRGFQAAEKQLMEGQAEAAETADVPEWRTRVSIEDLNKEYGMRDGVLGVHDPEAGRQVSNLLLRRPADVVVCRCGKDFTSLAPVRFTDDEANCYCEACVPADAIVAHLVKFDYDGQPGGELRKLKPGESKAQAQVAALIENIAGGLEPGQGFGMIRLEYPIADTPDTLDDPRMKAAIDQANLINQKRISELVAAAQKGAADKVADEFHQRVEQLIAGLRLVEAAAFAKAHHDDLVKIAQNALGDGYTPLEHQLALVRDALTKVAKEVALTKAFSAVQGMSRVVEQSPDSYGCGYNAAVDNCALTIQRLIDRTLKGAA